MSEEKSIGLFVFTVKYVLPTMLLCVFLSPIAKAVGIGGGATIFVFASILYLIYKFPSISRAMRQQEAIDLAEMEKAEYEKFLKENQKANKKKGLKR
jgi:preprotein translocase subunit SecY